MKSLRIYPNIFALIVTAALALPAARAQRGMGPGAGMRNYNPATEVTVRGTVEDVKQVTRRQGWGGTHLTLKSDAGTLDVHLGPSNFLQAKNFKISKGDQIEVVGSKVQYQGHDALLAREVKEGNETLTLRNAQGIPAWSRSARRY